jgi:hypothetical protein
MSHHLLQRALVVALHDPTFVVAMHRDPDTVLALLPDREKAQLLAVDPRAFRTDPLRTRRLLGTLAQEFPASTTLALAESRSLALAEGFFQSACFREAVLGSHPLVLAFGDYLAEAFREGSLTTPQLSDVIALESLTARCRRDRDRPPHHGVALAPGVRSAHFDAAVLDCVQTAERYLFELGLLPQLALCDDRPALPALPRVGEGSLFLLLTAHATGVALSPIDEGLHAVLTTVATPRPRAAQEHALVPCGIPAARATDLLDALVAEGLVVERLD